jgi:hypothetical protein
VGGHYLPAAVIPASLWQYHPDTSLGEEKLAELRRLIAPVVTDAPSQPAMGGGSGSSSSSEERKAKKPKVSTSASMASRECEHHWVDGVCLPAPLLQFLYRGTVPLD